MPININIGKFFIPINNWKVITLSFLGATTFWFFSALGKQYNTRISYPVEFIFNPDSLVVMEPLPQYIDLDVSGGGWDLFRQSFWFGADPIPLRLENPSTRFFTRSALLPVAAEHLNRFRINFLYTDTLFIHIDRKVKKMVKLDIDSMKISLENDYRLVSPITIEPDTAVIFGPASFIDALPEVFVPPVTAQKIDRDFDRFITLGLPETFDIYSDPPTTNVKFSVDRFDELQMPVTVELLNFPDDIPVTPVPKQVTVKFIVQRSLSEEFFEEDFSIFIDHGMVNQADSTAPAIIMIYPENALEIEVSPDTIKLSYDLP